MTIEQFKKFFEDRPALSPHGFAIDAKISPRLIAYIITGDRVLTDKTVNRIMPCLVKYGYKE